MKWNDLADQVTELINQLEFNLIDEREAKIFDRILTSLEGLDFYLEDYGEYLYSHAWDI